MNLNQLISLILVMFCTLVLILLYLALCKYRHKMTKWDHVFVRIKILSLTMLGATQVYDFLYESGPTLVLFKLATFVSISTGIVWIKGLDRNNMSANGTTKSTTGMV